MSNETELWTYRDALDSVMDAFDIDAGGRPYRNARRAVFEAYREFPYKTSWAYFDRIGALTTSASQSSSTITYDHTGGTYERQVTLASGTWPDWADFGTLYTNSNHYEVATRESDTVITLSANNNPGADLAAGTTYIIYRSVYPAPTDFRRADALVDLENHYWPDYLPPGEALVRSRGYRTPSTPAWYTIRSAGEYYGGMSFEFIPPPNAARTYHYIYEAKPRELKILETNTGTVTVSNGTTTATFSSAVLTDNHVGSVIRLSGSATAPTGKVPDLNEVDNLYVDQRTIQSVTSSTVAVLDTAVTQGFASVAYSISDPLDMESGAMMNYFLRLCEEKYAYLAKENDRQERTEIARKALREAMAASDRNRNTSADRALYAGRLRDYAEYS